MKPEQAERFFIEELFNKTQDKNILSQEKLEEVDKLTGDASTRRYYRIFTTKDSYVVCLDNPFDEEMEKHPFISVQQFLEQNQIMDLLMYLDFFEQIPTIIYYQHTSHMQVSQGEIHMQLIFPNRYPTAALGLYDLSLHLKSYYCICLYYNTDWLLGRYLLPLPKSS